MFGPVSKLTSAASKAAGAAANTVSGTVSFAEHEAAKVGGAVADTVSGTISFSEHQARKHVEAFTGLGSTSAAEEYVLKEFQDIKEKAPSDVDVDVDVIPARSGSSDQKSVLLKLSPKNVPEANKNAILVSSVLSAVRNEDDTSSVAVMLELARSVSHQASGFKNSVIFLMNTGEEEGLDGSHSFITQNPWNATIRLAVDLEGIGIGGQPITSQAADSKQGTGLKNPVVVLFDPNQHLPKQAVLDFQTMHSKGGAIRAQDLFSSGFIQPGTDFQVYKEVGGLSGLDFAFAQGDGAAVYHTKNDEYELLKPGSIHHLGENMLPFLLQAASRTD